MSEFMYAQVKDKIRFNIATFNFFTLSTSEATSNNNTSWLSMHVYTYKDWVRVPYLLKLSKIVGSPTTNHLTELVISAIEKDVDVGNLERKMLYFEADGAATF
jgi:hypothetical protein